MFIYTKLAFSKLFCVHKSFVSLTIQNSDAIMMISKKDDKFLSRSFANEKDFNNSYKQMYKETQRCQELYTMIMKCLEKTVKLGDLNDLKRYSKLINFIHNFEEKADLINYFNDPNNPLKKTNLVILAAKINRLDLLQYMFSNESNILQSLANVSQCLVPNAEDQYQHNVFYYAFRGKNTELLDVLLYKWPNNYFLDKPEKMNEILSTTYKEFKLKNVPLTEEVEMYVQSKLLNFRFPNSYCQSSCKNNFINERLDLIIEISNSLNDEYDLLDKPIDKIFLYKATFLAQNIHVLKQLLKFTYNIIPWEEMEFLLVSFIALHQKKTEINLFYRNYLGSKKIFYYLEYFIEMLLRERENLICPSNEDANFDLSKLDRKEVVKAIREKNQVLKIFYSDFREIRDIYSLTKINENIRLATKVDITERDGQMIIIRALQLLGEYTKNTMEFPNLSTAETLIIILTLRSETRDFVNNQRNSSSSRFSLDNRLNLESITNIRFFFDAQEDIKAVLNEVSNMLYKKKESLLKDTFQKLRNNKSLDTLKELIRKVDDAELDELTMGDNFRAGKLVKFQRLCDQLINMKFIIEQKPANFVSNLKEYIRKIEVQLELRKQNYITGFKTLKSITKMVKQKCQLGDFPMTSMRIIQCLCLEELSKLGKKIENTDLLITLRDMKKFLEEHSELSSYSDELDVFYTLVIEALHYYEIEALNTKKIEQIDKKLREKTSQIYECYQERSAMEFTKLIEFYNVHLNLIINDLKVVLQIYSKADRCDKKLQALIELLVLDITTILSLTGCFLQDNPYFLDDIVPLLTGEQLRGYLMNPSNLFDVLPFDPSIAVLLNAKKLALEDRKKTVTALNSGNYYSILKSRKKRAQIIVL